MALKSICTAMSLLVIASGSGYSAGSSAESTLIIVASQSAGEATEHEFIVIRSRGATTTWQVTGPRGRQLAAGHTKGSITHLQNVAARVVRFRKETTKRSNDRPARTLDSARPDNPGASGMATFSLLYLAPNGTQTCLQQLTRAECQTLANSPEVQAILGQVRKQVFGKRYAIPNLFGPPINPSNSAKQPRSR